MLPLFLFIKYSNLNYFNYFCDHYSLLNVLKENYIKTNERSLGSVSGQTKFQK